MYARTHFFKARRRLNSEFFGMMQGRFLYKSDNIELNINVKLRNKNVYLLYNIVKCSTVALAYIDYNKILKVLLFVRNVKNMHYSA